MAAPRDVQPLIGLLESTPAEQLIERLAAQVREGVSYRQVLAALLLAGVRNIQPRPSVGFKFHAVLVVNSAHLASVSGPPADRWLPIFWAADYFKTAQAQDEREGDWTLGSVRESAVPPAHRARAAFIDAMDRWDEEAADAAAAGLCRSAGMHEVFELLLHYGCRDFRSIGHKAIYVANSYRTLQVIGWQYAEPVVRSLAYALLNHVGEPNPAESDLAPDRPWRSNQLRADGLREDWLSGRHDAAATDHLLSVLRNGSAEEASRAAAETINGGVHPQSVWDAVFTAAGEWVLRQPGILALHAVTCANALYYGFATAASDGNRRRLLLQAVAFVPLFRESMARRGQVADMTIEALGAESAGTLESVFAANHSDRLGAARSALAFLRSGGSATDLIHTARRLVFVKGNNAHDYKYSSAVLEDFQNLSPRYRDSYLAACTGLLNSAAQPDNSLVQRIRQALTSTPPRG